MIVSMCNWAGSAKNLPEWFRHGEEAEVSWEQIQELFDTGNNVMLRHITTGKVTASAFLFVDDRGFSQR